MSTATSASERDFGVSGAPTRELRTKHAHAGIAMAVATFAMAAAAGIQAVMYLSEFGVNARTDGLFVGFALYAVFGVFSQSIRVTSVPLLVGRRPRVSPRQFAYALGFVAVAVIIVTGPFAEILAGVLAPGLAGDGRATAEQALPILGGAMVLQLFAAGGATLLAVQDRFLRVAVAYAVGAVAGLAAYLALVGLTDELSLGWSMLAMAVVTCAIMLTGVSRAGLATPSTNAGRGQRILAITGLIFARTAVYLVFNSLYLVTLAFTSNFEAGDATVLSYAYLFASYLVAGTGFALGMSRIADMRRGALADWKTMATDTVPPGFRYSMLLVAPALAGLVAAGAPLIGELFPDSLSSADAGTLRVFGALLIPWTVAALLVNLMLPVMFAMGKARLVNAVAPALLVLQIAATAAGAALAGAEGAVGAAFIAPACFAAALVVLGAPGEVRRLAAELAWDGLRFLASAAVCFGMAAALGAALANGLASSFIAAAVGTILYLAALLFLAPRQVKLLSRSLWNRG